MSKRKWINSDPAVFSKIETLTKEFDAVGRTQSAALLIWFLQNIYRLDEFESEDAVCDKKHDAGVDAIVVNDAHQEIVLFQAKRKEKIPATLGDTDLKEFYGSLQQFTDKGKIEKLIATSENSELKRILIDEKVGEKIDTGYKVRAVFVTNIAANHDAQNYLGALETSGHSIDLWDLIRLGPVIRQLEKEWFLAEETRLKAHADMIFWQGARTNPDLIYAAIPAKMLTKMPGIEDTRIFAQNVRLGLGKTRVNSEILESIKNKGEHSRFLAFHNGLTIVAQKLTVRGSVIKMSHFSVCNGCQSLLTLHANHSILTDELLIPVRIVRVDSDREISEIIAYRTNNQNAVSLKDLSANDAAQVQLKAEFDALFGYQTIYSIKRGDSRAPKSSAEPLANEVAGQLLLSLFEREPWSAHQKYRIFGDLEARIFRYGVNATHIRLAQLAMNEVVVQLQTLKHERVRRYSLTKFVVLFLLGEVLRKEDAGLSLLSAPLPYLQQKGGDSKRQSLLTKSFGDLLQFVITELNYIIDEKEKQVGGFDYKTEFKSAKDVGSLRAEILKAYDKDKFKGRVTPFSLPK